MKADLRIRHIAFDKTIPDKMTVFCKNEIVMLPK